MTCINILTIEVDKEDLEFLKLLIETIFDGVEGSTTISWDHFKKHQSQEFDIIMTDKRGVRAFNYLEAKVLSFMIDTENTKINVYQKSRRVSKEEMVSMITQSILGMQNSQVHCA